MSETSLGHVDTHPRGQNGGCEGRKAMRAISEVFDGHAEEHGQQSHRAPCKKGGVDCNVQALR